MMIGNRQARAHAPSLLYRLTLILCSILLIALSSGCSIIRTILEPLPPPPTLPSVDMNPATTVTQTSVTTIGTTATTQGATTATTRPSGSMVPSSPTSGTTAAQPGDAFRSKVTSLIISGLNAVSREIVLDEALAGLKIPEANADSTIELVFDLFQTVYYSNPQYYFLNGQANAGYVLMHGTATTLQSITLKPGFIDSAASLDTAAIKARQATLEQTAAAIAAAAKKQGTGAVKQLQYVHDSLIRSIKYDVKAGETSTLNRERSNAASALLDHLALCQGYSSAFQLVAQKLGIEVMMMTGTAEGVNHAWNLVKIDAKYQHVDLTYDDPTPDSGANAPVDHIHFLRSDAMMRETHVWQAADFPPAPADGAQYYRDNGLVSASRKDLQTRLNSFVADLPKTIDQPRQMEVLYTAKDIPSLNTVENMLQEALTKAGRTGQILYKRRVDKSVVLIEFLPA